MKKLTFLFAFIFLFTSFVSVVHGQTCVNGKTASGLTCVPITTPSGTGDSSSNGTAPAATTNSVTPCGSACNLGYTPLEPIPGLTTGTSGKYDLTSATGFANLINAIFTVLISAGALLAVVSLTIGGVQYMVSGAAATKGKAMERVRASLWGIMLIAGIWLILNTVNPQLLKFNFNPCPVNSSTCASINYSVTTSNNTTAATTNTSTGAPSNNGVIQSPYGTIIARDNTDRTNATGCANTGGTWSIWTNTCS